MIQSTWQNYWITLLTTHIHKRLDFFSVSLSLSFLLSHLNGMNGRWVMMGKICVHIINANKYHGKQSVCVSKNLWFNMTCLANSVKYIDLGWCSPKKLYFKHLSEIFFFKSIIEFSAWSTMDFLTSSFSRKYVISCARRTYIHLLHLNLYI